MSYLNYNTSLEYFNSIPSYGKAVPESNSKGQLTGFYHIKFNCNIELARAVYMEFLKLRPSLTNIITFHVNMEGTGVIFGGRFSAESKAKNTLYDLLDKHKLTLGKYKKKEVAA